MANLTTLRPDGTGTLSLVNDEGGGTTDIHLKVDDDPDLPTITDYIKNSNDTTGNKTAFLLMTATDADFLSMTTLQVDVHVVASVFVDDTCTLFARMYQSDETTTLTDEVQVATQASIGLQSVAFTGVSAGDKTTWDGARLRLRWAYARNMGADAAQLRVTAVELDGTYAASVPNEDKSDSDSATLADSTYVLESTASDSATLADSTVVLTVTASGTDSVALADSTYVLDPGAGTDSIALADSTITLTVVATGTDSHTLADATYVLDPGAGTDSATVTDNDGTALETISKSGTDAFAMAEAFTLTVTLVVSDTGTLAETVAITATVSGSDSHALAETGNATVTLSASDTLAAGDAGATSVALAGSDGVAYAEAMTLTVAAGGTDSAAQAESSGLTVSAGGSDTLTFADVLNAFSATLPASDPFALADTGAVTVPEAFIVTDGVSFVSCSPSVALVSPVASASRIVLNDNGGSGV